MKLHDLQLSEDRPSKGPQVQLLAKAVKELELSGARKYMPRLNEVAVETAIQAYKDNVKAGYWNYVAQASDAAKTGGDLGSLGHALLSMKRVRPNEISYVNELGTKVVGVLALMEEARGLFKGMDATHQVLTMIADAAGAGDSYKKAIATAVLKKLGVHHAFAPGAA